MTRRVCGRDAGQCVKSEGAYVPTRLRVRKAKDHELFSYSFLHFDIGSLMHGSSVETCYRPRMVAKRGCNFLRLSCNGGSKRKVR